MIKSVLHLAHPRDQVYDVLANFGEYQHWSRDAPAAR